jgi:hypothetical protein
MRAALILFFFAFLFGNLPAQDTFYVKKKEAPIIVSDAVAPDSSNHDSIVSYTMEYQREGSNIWVVAHMGGPYLVPPSDAAPGKRILFTEIIAVDRNGRKYSRPDQYYNGGIWVDVNSPGK